ncbi:MAG: Gfo/Idh/MocA family oxidoreductase [Hyphomicrobiaceae bacterium]|nr:Gfo/Idh/MocA family oxidoreductase [Hyphomicrobiaceae bacterium]
MGHRLALIGLGMAVTPHARALLDLAREGRCEVVAAMAPSAARRARFAATFPFPTTGDLDAVLADPAITSVGILTPPDTHLDLVRRAASAGKHILLEKPLEISTARAEALVTTAERAGVTLAVMLQHRFRPAGERLRAILVEGRLGRIVNCSTSIRLWRPQSYYDEPGRGTYARDGGGVLMTQAIHTLDLMLALVGPVSEVRGFVTTSEVHRMETEDMVAAGVRFASGAIGVIEATTAAYPGFPERIDIAGTKGSASLGGTSLSVTCADGTREDLHPDGSAGGTGADPMAFPHDYHRAAWADFLAAVDKRGNPRVTGREGLRVHRLIDALLTAGASGVTTRVAG